MNTTIYIAGDQYAVELMSKIKEYLTSKGQAYEDLGSHDAQQRVSLQEIIPAVTSKVLSEQDSTGILICGSGVGVEIGANKFRGIRASLCLVAKQAEYARFYDNANVLCLSSWLTEKPDEIIQSWLQFRFDDDQKRAQMLEDFESWI